MATFTADYSELNIRILLDKELVRVHFQPIFSIREKKIIGFEGLSRGIHPHSGKLFPPLMLLKAAREAGLILELDRLFRKKILEAFRDNFPQPNDLILSLNFETSTLDKEIGTLHLIQLCRQLKVNPSTVVIEILESQVKNVEALAKFVNIHRERGFHVALDDVGKGHSNMDRIPVIRPDIIKIDHSLVSRVHEDHYRLEVFKSLVNLSQKIGALALAEGVETEAEALEALELGADLLQGFYLSEPKDPDTDFSGPAADKLNTLALKFRTRMIEKFNIRKIQQERYSLMLEDAVKELSNKSQKDMDGMLPKILLEQPVAEAIYVLDQKGLQCTDMACKKDRTPPKGIFRLPPKGTDYTTRDYYYTLVEPGFKRESYTSEPYISPATGLFCVTISIRFKDKKGTTLILCVDVVPPSLKDMGRIMTLFGG